MMLLVLSVIHLFVQNTAALECFSCQAVNDANSCNNTLVCKDGQACFLNTSSIYQHHMNVLGCIDNQQCAAHGNIPATIVGRDLNTRQTTDCIECCSSDHCNKNLCEHLKPQSCIDDESIDCARLNSLFNICNDISQAKKVCPKFCNLCNVVDGNWTPWSAWSSCDVTCEKGLQTRTRSCTNPAPQYGGQMCLGNSTDNKVCELDLCPIHGGWSQWQEWGSCSVTCGMGMKSRSRDCSNPPPSRFGDHCFGHNQESQLCMPKICSNGGWSAWEMWGSCSVTCGNGIKSRFRSCTNPKPSPYGQYCEGHHSEIYSCSKISCDLSHCQPDPCVHGSCIDLRNDFLCTCDQGFEGRNCNISNSMCKSNPCVHGTCFDNKDGFVCSCAAGFKGKYCNTNIDECISNPCGFGGTCYDTRNGYHCVCAPGFSGVNCETDIDDCLIGLCGTYGTCIDGINNYTCACETGLTGNNCEINIDDCLIGLCGTHGTCNDKLNGYMCMCAPGFTGNNCETRLQADCSGIKHHNVNATNGVYSVLTWKTNRTIQVYCDMTTAGGGWTVFQNRFDGSVNFTRNFSEYVNGFGDIYKEFWLGLENLHELVSQGNYELRIDVTAANGSKGYETFPNFAISAGSDYTLHISLGRGSIGDNGTQGMSYHIGMPFSTFDHDRDHAGFNCAQTFKSGWWYSSCMSVHLNGVYYSPGTIDYRSMSYFMFTQGNKSLKTSRMMFRKV